MYKNEHCCNCCRTNCCTNIYEILKKKHEPINNRNQNIFLIKDGYIYKIKTRKKTAGKNWSHDGQKLWPPARPWGLVDTVGGSTKQGRGVRKCGQGVAVVRRRNRGDSKTGGGEPGGEAAAHGANCVTQMNGGNTRMGQKKHVEKISEKLKNPQVPFGKESQRPHRGSLGDPPRGRVHPWSGCHGCSDRVSTDRGTGMGREHPRRGSKICMGPRGGEGFSGGFGSEDGNQRGRGN